ncbi:MAG: hypothetical protein DWQ05_05200 [Calditrichaeota bacterium]|nr:MAG: hypothetical protein DWQ05_05200 [Calditrichota bacterium]
MALSNLAFLDVFELEDGRYRGAILLTSPDAAPLEFYLSEPIRPTEENKLYYGAVFEEHLHVSVLGNPLINRVQKEPDVVLIRNPFLEKVAKSQTLALALVKAPDVIEKIVEGEKERTAEIEEGIKKFATEYELFEPFERIRKIVERFHNENPSIRRTRPAEKVPSAVESEMQ